MECTRPASREGKRSLSKIADRDMKEGNLRERQQFSTLQGQSRRNRVCIKQRIEKGFHEKSSEEASSLHGKEVQKKVKRREDLYLSHAHELALPMNRHTVC